MHESCQPRVGAKPCKAVVYGHHQLHVHFFSRPPCNFILPRLESNKTRKEEFCSKSLCYDPFFHCLSPSFKVSHVIRHRLQLIYASRLVNSEQVVAVIYIGTALRLSHGCIANTSRRLILWKSLPSRRAHIAHNGTLNHRRIASYRSALCPGLFSASCQPLEIDFVNQNQNTFRPWNSPLMIHGLTYRQP
jgi:hypothetical protein